MATITLKGKTIHTVGELPSVGSAAPDFRLVRGDLTDARLADFDGEVKILNIVPSLDTSTCALSARRFNGLVAELQHAVLLNISCDLPFAASRFCKAEGLAVVVSLSQMRDKSFGRDYGVEIADGPLAGIFSRAVLVLDAGNRVVYGEQVPEIANEPEYGAAFEAAKKAVSDSFSA